MPKISVIIATMNVDNLIEKTLNSIISQTLKDIQIIIVDGNSTDNTLQVLHKYRKHISKLICESDTGIYDAWNKAIPFINSNWIQFLGAGDVLASNDLYEKMICDLNNAFPRHNMVYGNLLLMSEHTNEVFEKISIAPENVMKLFTEGRFVTPIHPETFCHISTLKKYKFDKKYTFSGDYKFMLQSLSEKPPLYVDINVDKMVVGGISNDKKNLLKIYRESQMVNKELGIKIPLIHTFRIYIILNFKFLLYKILHKNILSFLINFKRFLLRKNPY
jgi:glycosyltransferase involved in cell wall biosynthesis